MHVAGLPNLLPPVLYAPHFGLCRRCLHIPCGARIRSVEIDHHCALEIDRLVWFLQTEGPQGFDRSAKDAGALLHVLVTSLQYCVEGRIRYLPRIAVCSTIIGLKIQHASVLLCTALSC